MRRRARSVSASWGQAARDGAQGAAAGGGRQDEFGAAQHLQLRGGIAGLESSLREGSRPRKRRAGMHSFVYSSCPQQGIIIETDLPAAATESVCVSTTRASSAELEPELGGRPTNVDPIIDPSPPNGAVEHVIHVTSIRAAHAAGHAADASQPVSLVSSENPTRHLCAPSSFAL
jgi:hypothetical protein